MTIEKKLSTEQRDHLANLTATTKVLRSQEEQVRYTRALQAELIVSGRAQGLSVNNIAKATGLSTSRVGHIWRKADHDPH